jgi:RNA polymerase sigma-70 factor (ECF subfamily)
MLRLQLKLGLIVMEGIQESIEQFEPPFSDDLDISLDLEQNDDVPAILVRGLIERDPNAASLFHQKYGRLISHLVWRLLGADPEHDDVVHQVYVNILESIDSLRTPDSLKSWVTGVAINTVRREIYRRRFRRLFHFVPDYSKNEIAASTPEKGVAIRRFYELLEKIGVERRVVLLLNLMEGYTLNEIALMCKISVPTAKRRFQSGKKRLYELAKNEPLFTEWICE